MNKILIYLEPEYELLYEFDFNKHITVQASSSNKSIIQLSTLERRRLNLGPLLFKTAARSNLFLATIAAFQSNLEHTVH